MTLAETLYSEFFAERHPDVTTKDFANLSPEARGAWERVAAKASEPVTLPPADVVEIDITESSLTLRLTFTDVELCRAVMDGQRDFNRSAYATFEDGVARHVANWLSRWPDLAEAVRDGIWRRTEHAAAGLVPLDALRDGLREALAELRAHGADLDVIQRAAKLVES